MSFKNFTFTFIIWLVVFSQAVFAILPENVGGTQYATGHLAAAEKYRTSVSNAVKKLGLPTSSATKYYEYLEQFLISEGDTTPIFNSIFKTAEERKEFFKMVLKIQQSDSALKPPLIMIGNSRAIATDGHHRIRTSGKIHQMLEDAYKIWPEELGGLLSDVGRMSPDGKPILSVDFKQVKIIAQLPEDASAADVVKKLLGNGKGLWKDPLDQKLAEKFYGGDGIGKASLEELNYLGSKLGIKDNPITHKVQFIPIAELPDSAARTLIGRWFDSRTLKIGFNYRDYAEFHVGDDVRNIVAEAPGKYPNLKKILELEDGASVQLQKKYLTGALSELDSILVTNAKFKNNLASLSKSPSFLSHSLLSIHSMRVGPSFSTKCFGGFKSLLLKMR